MKNIICILLSFLTVIPSFASTPEWMNQSNSANYKVLGRGIIDSETKEVIVLSCLDESCTELQHLKISENSAERFGAIYKVNSVHKNALKIAVKKINQEYKTYKRNTYKNKNIRIALPYAGALIGGVLGVVFPISLYGVFGLLVAGVFLGKGDAPMNKHQTEISKATIDQNGWNWAEKPESISHRKFVQYFEFVSSQK